MNEEILDEFHELPKNIEYVSLMRRFNASLLDSLIIGVFAFGINILTAGRGMSFLGVVPIVADLLYKVVLEKEFGQTPGKKAVGIVVVGEDMRKISWQQCFIRNYYYVIGVLLGLIQYYFAYKYEYQASKQGLNYTDAMFAQFGGPYYLNYVNYAFMIWFIIDCLMMSKSARNQTLHDKWANTFVVKDTFLIK